MKPLTVAYLGPPASYTHQAAHNTFPPSSSTTLKPYPTIPDVFAAVHSGLADRGVVPFENSTYGPVLTTLDLFASCLSQVPQEAPKSDVTSRAKRYDQIGVCGEAFVQVRHFLLGRRRSAASEGRQATPLASSASAESHPSQPQATTQPQAPTQPQAQTQPPSPSPSLAHIRTVLSHEQALGQCKNFLSSYLPHAEKKEVSSTSKAAELAAADETGETAAISSEMAAGVYGLDVLRPGIQDREDNVTRFMVLRRSGEEGEDGDGKDGEVNGRGRAHQDGRENEVVNGAAANEDRETKHFKALVLFTVDHTSPGALADSLAVFKRHNLNLTSINTRPSGFAPWNYYFFVEVSGMERDQERLQASLEDLGGLAKSWKCLGSSTIG